MAMQKQTAEHISRWLVEEWGRCFASVMESMADQKPAVSYEGVPRTWTAAQGAINSEQEFSLGPHCLMWASVPELVWREAGTAVLRVAGFQEVARDDARSTFQEVLGQTFALVAQGIGERLGREVTCDARSEVQDVPESIAGFLLSVDLPGSAAIDDPLFISASPELLEPLLETFAEAFAGTQAAGQQPGHTPSSMSKTTDLLLGVHLPVSVSFGKTTMLVKEVLKLTTGSIVELNRAVTEPVDIIVNNCIIARGEVVVVSGNYGVRVREIVSRQQRYQTGTGQPLPPPQ